MKTWWKSKTLWANVLVIIALFVQDKFGYKLEPDVQAKILGVINIVLRLVTREEISWQ